MHFRKLAVVPHILMVINFYHSGVGKLFHLHFGAWRPFLVFNVADAAITIGVVILLFRALFVRDKTAPSADAPAPVENQVNA